MARFRNLQDVAAGLVGAFISRHNDIDGYWALGLLRADLPDGEGVVRLSLHAGSATPATPSTRLLLARYSERLRVMLAHHGFVPADLVTAEIVTQFDAAVPIPSWREYSYGEPFRCTVTLTDRRSHTSTATNVGRCARHNAAAERRSTRAR